MVIAFETYQATAAWGHIFECVVQITRWDDIRLIQKRVMIQLVFYGRIDCGDSAHGHHGSHRRFQHGGGEPHECSRPETHDIDPAGIDVIPCLQVSDQTADFVDASFQKGSSD